MATNTDGLRVGSIAVNGVPIEVRELMAGEFDEVESCSFVREEGKASRVRVDRALVLRYGVIDGLGKQVYTDADIESLRKKPHRFVTPIYEKIMELTNAAESVADAKKG